MVAAYKKRFSVTLSKHEFSIFLSLAAMRGLSVDKAGAAVLRDYMVKAGALPH